MATGSSVKPGYIDVAPQASGYYAIVCFFLTDNGECTHYTDVQGVSVRLVYECYNRNAVGETKAPPEMIIITAEELSYL